MSNIINRLSKCCLLFIWLIAIPVVWVVFALIDNIYTLKNLPWFIFIVSIVVPLLLFAISLKALVMHMKLKKLESNKATKSIRVHLIVQMLVITLSLFILFINLLLN